MCVYSMWWRERGGGLLHGYCLKEDIVSVVYIIF